MPVRGVLWCLRWCGVMSEMSAGELPYEPSKSQVHANTHNVLASTRDIDWEYDCCRVEGGFDSPAGVALSESPGQGREQPLCNPQFARATMMPYWDPLNAEPSGEVQLADCNDIRPLVTVLREV